MVNSDEVDQPLRAASVRGLIRQILASGTVVFTDHAMAELAGDGLATVDAIRVLRSGVVDEAEWEHGAWRHHVRRPKVTVIVELESEVELVVVTAWRSER